MRHPWDLDADWVEEGLEYYNVTPSSPGWEDYEGSVKAYYYNSLGFPTEVGLFILGLFSIVVLLIAAKQLAAQVPSIKRFSQSNRVLNAITDQFTQAPLIRKRHQRPLPILGHFVSLHLPLRLDTFFILVLALINLVSIVTLYRPYRKNNLYWPDAHTEMLRYISDRSGVVATMQFPLLFLLSGRNNLVSWLTGASFDRCMLYHRWIARFVFAQVLVHAIGYSLLYAQDTTYGYSYMFLDPYLRWGTAATVAFGPLIFLSLRWLRQKAYEIFVLVHIAMAVVCVIGTYYHIQLLNVQVAGEYDDFIFAIYASIAFWSFDKLVRFVRLARYSVSIQASARKLTFTHSKLDVICNAERGVIVRHVVQLKSNVDAGGRYVQLWMPRLQPFSSHPFTVADVHTAAGAAGTQPVSHMYLYSKVHSGVTSKLLRSTVSSPAKAEVALIEGFYGSVPDLSSFTDTIFASAGVGITLCMPLFKRRVQSGQPATLIWIIPQQEFLAMLADMLTRIEGTEQVTGDEMDEAQPRKSKQTIKVFITQKALHGDRTDDMSTDTPVQVLRGGVCDQDRVSSNEEKTSDFDTGRFADVERSAFMVGVQLSIVEMHGRRPDMHSLISDSVAMASTRQTGLIACGPDTFCDDARRASRALELHYFEEAFQW